MLKDAFTTGMIRMSLVSYLWVAIGGAIGSVARFWVGLQFASSNTQLPIATIAINVSGSFVIAFVTVLTTGSGRLPLPENLRLFIIVGLCGGYTTFSAFSLQTLELLRNGFLGRALINVALSIFLCLMAAALGYYCAWILNTKQ